MVSPRQIGLLAVLLLASATAATAGDGWWGCPYVGYAGWADYGLESVPFHALHPPVYYSYAVPRPYGHSPFAYPPGTPTPEVALPPQPQPQTMLNPFVPQASPTAAKPEQTAGLPLRIRNPFVAQSDATPVPAEWSESPQVVYPAKLTQTF
jgi:hypothetical protein